jgi:hypothetical protein
MVNVNVADIVANDGLTFKNGYAITNSEIDLRKEFDIVVCFSISDNDLSYIRGVVGSDQEKVTVGAQISIATTGEVYGFLFYGGANDWKSSVLIISSPDMLVKDGTTKNYIKLSITANNKFVLSHSADGVNYVINASSDIPSGLSFAYPIAPVTFGGYAQYVSENLMPANRLSIHRCCIKQDGNSIWGKEV